jgi:hypothetical protein
MADLTQDIEQERKRLLGEFAAEHGEDWSASYEVGTFGCHELLDRTAIAAEHVEHYILSHPSCVLHPGWHALAARATQALHELHQSIGKEHLEHDEGGAA